jgi:hypothetical protein
MFVALCTGTEVTDKVIQQYCPYALNMDNEDAVQCKKAQCRKTSTRVCFRCKEYKAGKKKAKAFNMSMQLEGTCQEIESLYFKTIPVIESSDDEFMKGYLQDHTRVIESRADLNICQKASRRKILLSLWENSCLKKKGLLPNN